MTELALLGLAAHRFWVLWFMPADMRTPLTIAREWLGRRHWLIAKAATCAVCMTIWASVGILLTWRYAPVLVWLLVLSELIGWLEAALRKLEH